jgi:hypothetical protein
LAATDGAASTLAAANVADGSIIAKLASKTANGAAPENFNCTTDSLEAQRDNFDTKYSLVQHEKIQPSDPSATISGLLFDDTAADADFPNVVVPSGFLPTGYTLVAVYAGYKYDSLTELSGAINSISEAGDAIRQKLSTGAWGTDDLEGIVLANGDWYLYPYQKRPGTGWIWSTVDIKAEVTGDNVTVNFRSEETNRADAITTTAASIRLDGVQTAIKYVYTL